MLTLEFNTLKPISTKNTSDWSYHIMRRTSLARLCKSRIPGNLFAWTEEIVILISTLKHLRESLQVAFLAGFSFHKFSLETVTRNLLTLGLIIYFSVSLSHRRSRHFVSKLNLLSFDRETAEWSGRRTWNLTTRVQFPPCTCYTTIPNFISSTSLVNSQLVSSLPPVGILNVV